MGLSLITFILGFLADVFLSQKLFNVKNAIAVVATPLEVLISMLYWGIVAVSDASFFIFLKFPS